MKIYKLLRLSVIISTLMYSQIFSQPKGEKPPEIQVVPDEGNNSFRGFNTDKQNSHRSEMLRNKLMELKRSGSKTGYNEIQKQIDVLDGSVSEVPEAFELTLIKSGNEVINDNINATFVSGVTGVKGIATATEQTSGRMWTAFGYGPLSGPTPDNLRLCYRDFSGIVWNHWVTLGFSAGNRMQMDQIDMEIIENYNTGEKYIYIVFGYTNSSGNYRIGVSVVKISSPLNYSGYTLNWPGTSSLTVYQRPRVISDNEAYPGNPWIYIVSCIDSIGIGGSHAGEKTAIVYSPYTVTPTFTYKSTAFVGLIFRYPTDFHTDIAYFRNGGNDSILLVESSLEDSSRIMLFKTSIGNFVSSPFAAYVGNISTINYRPCYQAYIASAGGYNNMMIVNLRKYNETDWDIEYYKSTNGSGSWSNGYVDYRTNYSTRADIIGFRSAPGYYACAYSENTNSFIPVVYSYCSLNVWGPLIQPTNHTSTNPFHAQPRAGIKYGVTEESCFTLWTEYSGGTNVWNSVGCSGPVQVPRNINLRGIMQGFWDVNANTLRNDTMKLYLHNDYPPYSIVDSAKSYLDNNAYADFWFYNLQNFTNYYIAAKHRNTIETWSSTPVVFGSGSTSMSYDFTSSSVQSYGSNVMQVDASPVLYAFYGGDVNQDASVDLTDIVLVYNDGNNFVSGYVKTDTNGDGFADLSDLVITYNNSNNFVAVIRP